MRHVRKVNLTCRHPTCPPSHINTVNCNQVPCVVICSPINNSLRILYLPKSCPPCHDMMLQLSSMPEGNAAYLDANELTYVTNLITTRHRFRNRVESDYNKNRCRARPALIMHTDVPRISRRFLVSLLPLIPLAYFVNPADSVPDDDSDRDGFRKLPCQGENCRPVEVRDFRVGTGRQVDSQSTVVLKWTGRLADRFGWPYQREEDDPVAFDMARDPLIDGFVQGIVGMKEGGKRRILIPGQLGYKDERTGPLPSDFGDRRRLFATVLNKRRFVRAGDLVIDVQLKKVRPPK